MDGSAALSGPAGAGQQVVMREPAMCRRRSDDRLRLSRVLCSGVLDGLRVLATTDDATSPPARRAALEADNLRTVLRDTVRHAAPEQLAEVEDLRCHLHDTTLQVLEYVAAGGYGLCTETATINEVAAHASADLIEWLRAPQAPPDLSAQLVDVVREAQAFGLAGLELHVAANLPVLERAAARALTGAMREALTNTRKHAHASRVRVTAVAGDGQVDVVVLDDGIGIASIAGDEGLGIAHSVRGRLARAGGDAVLRSELGRGTEVRLTMVVRP
jgi:anti-sigma regulatory factor (Ser/Thr protein kinase)